METKRKFITIFVAVLVVLTAAQAAGCKKEQPPAVTVSMGASEITLDLFGSGVLKATVTGSDAAIEWRSDNNAVVTVDSDGRVYPKSEGVAIVSATVGEATASCTVYVEDSGEMPSVHLNYTALEMTSGTTITLSAEAVYKGERMEATFAFSTLNAAVATVSEDGKVTAVASGNTFVVASAVINGVTVYGQVSVAVLR